MKNIDSLVDVSVFNIGAEDVEKGRAMVCK
jgi:hypothetical protein